MIKTSALSEAHFLLAACRGEIISLRAGREATQERTGRLLREIGELIQRQEDQERAATDVLHDQNELLKAFAEGWKTTKLVMKDSPAEFRRKVLKREDLAAPLIALAEKVKSE